MGNTEQLVTMLSNILDAIKEGQIAAKKIEQQVAELKELKSSTPTYVYIVKTYGINAYSYKGEWLCIGAKTKDEALNWIKTEADKSVRGTGGKLEIGKNSITWLNSQNDIIQTWEVVKVKYLDE